MVKKKYHTKVLEKISSVIALERVDLATKMESMKKVLENISSAIALRQVNLATKMESVKKVLEKFFTLYTKLCNVDLFTKENQQAIEHLQGNLQLTGSILKLSPDNSQIHFQRLLMTQSRLSKLQATNANIRYTLISIQSMLRPHMEVLQKELAFVDTLMKKDSQLSTHEGLVDLATNLEI